MKENQDLKGFKAMFVLPPFKKEHKITPPVGIGYLAVMLENKGAECFFIDGIRDRLKISKICEMAEKINPDIIGVTTITPMYKETKHLVQALKEKGFKVVLGGPHSSALPKETLKDMGADFLIYGEGEITIVELCDYLFSKKEKLKDIKGLVFKEKGKITINEPRDLIKDIDAIPFPAWHLFPPNKYPFAPQGTMAKNYPIANMITSRGCPFNCSFCSTNIIWKRKYRARSARNIVNEIEMLIKDFKVKEIHFVDDNLTMNKKKIIDLCDELIKRQIKISWACPNGVRIDRLDKEILKKMKQAGCYSLSFGIESGNQEILNGINKQIKLEQIEEIVKLTKEIGIEARGFFILGLPNDDNETINQTIRFSKKLPLNFAGFSILAVMPGSEVFNKWVTDNKMEIKDINWDNFDSYNSKVSVCKVSPKRLKQLCSKANREFYLRLKILSGFFKYAKQSRWIIKRLLHYY